MALKQNVGDFVFFPKQGMYFTNFVVILIGVKVSNHQRLTWIPKYWSNTPHSQLKC